MRWNKPDIIFGVPVTFPIKVKPWWIRIFAAKYAWVALWGTLYAPSEERIEWAVGGEIEAQALLVHEGTHFVRQKSIPFWYTQYVFNKVFRFREEVIAYANELLFLRKHASNPSLTFYAHKLADTAVYGSMTTHPEALSALRKTIEENPEGIV